MAKTELTLRIEDLLYSYNPSTTGGCKINKFRGRHIGYEVPVSTGTTSDGIVDCVRVDEILTDEQVIRKCSVAKSLSWYTKYHADILRYVPCKKGISDIRLLPVECTENCRSNSCFKQYTNEICITCYEIKVSLSDFRSKHGHNFCGNANYYVMPSDLYKIVASEIPKNIGVIVYRLTDNQESLRRVKECEFIHLDAEKHRWMLLNVMKKQLNRRSQQKLSEAVIHLHSKIPRECSTCDFMIRCKGNDDIKKRCSISTGNSENPCFWKCQDDVLHKAGISVGSNNGQEYDI